MTLWLCDSVTLCATNGLISLPPFIRLGPYLAGRQPCVWPKRPAIWGPNYMRWQFFHKRYPLWILILYKKMFLKVKIGPVWADWPTPPFVQNGPHCRTPNTWVRKFFHKTDPLLILILCKKTLENFQNGPFWANWQTPNLSKRPTKWGLKYMSWQFFSKNRPPFNFDFVHENVL